MPVQGLNMIRKRENMKGKNKIQIIVWASLLALSPHWVNAGFPVTDIGANFKLDLLNTRLSEGLVRISQQISQNIKAVHDVGNNTNQKKSFTNLVDIDDMLKVDITEKLVYLKLYQSALTRCASVGGAESKDLCIKVVNIDKKKIDLYYESIAKMQQANNELKEAIKRQNNAKDRGEADTYEREIQAKLIDFQRIEEVYNQNIKLLETKKEFINKQREEIARNKIDGGGAFSGLVQAGKKAAVALYLEKKTKKFKDQAREIRARNEAEANQHVQQLGK